MKTPTCTKTMSGKHMWRTRSLDFNGYTWTRRELENPECEYCGIIDDRKKAK